MAFQVRTTLFYFLFTTVPTRYKEYVLINRNGENVLKHISTKQKRLGEENVLSTNFVPFTAHC